MKSEIKMATSHNTRCHSCSHTLNGRNYTRITDIGSSRWGGDVHLSICDICLTKMYKATTKRGDDDGLIDS
jgi:hypothetical protein